MSKKTKSVDIQCTSAFMAAGKMITKDQMVRGVPEPEALGLVRRGKAKIVEDAEDAGDDKALDEMTVAELKALAQELEIDGADGMKKAELIAAIEAAEDEGE
jgi:hypothetical protein